MSDKPKKPDREPDYINPKNKSYFWFEEMIYMNVRGDIIELSLHPENGKLCIKGLEDLGPKAVFKDEIQHAKDKWWYDIFESKFLGSGDAEQADNFSQDTE